MQGILITLATAVILAIVSAFAAPLVVDWNAWRAAFESEASRTIGAPVLIRGRIDAELLPVPRVVLRNVSVGADAISTGGTIAEVRADFSLGALMRGAFEAGSVRLVRPQLRLVLDSAGRVALPTGAGTPTGLAVSQLTVDDGSLDILDRGADRTLRLTDLDLKGEARSLTGPFRLEGEVESGGRRYGLRLNLAKAGAEPARLRLIADDRSRPLTLDLDGTFRLDQGTPRYDGRAALTRKPLCWRHGRLEARRHPARQPRGPGGREHRPDGRRRGPAGAVERLGAPGLGPGHGARRGAERAHAGMPTC